MACSYAVAAQQDQPPHLYVLLLTGKAGCQDMVEGLEAGADDYVSKPVNPTVLLAHPGRGSDCRHAARTWRIGRV